MQLLWCTEVRLPDPRVHVHVQHLRGGPGPSRFKPLESPFTLRRGLCRMQLSWCTEYAFQIQGRMFMSNTFMEEHIQAVPSLLKDPLLLRVLQPATTQYKHKVMRVALESAPYEQPAALNEQLGPMRVLWTPKRKQSKRRAH